MKRSALFALVTVAVCGIVVIVWSSRSEPRAGTDRRGSSTFPAEKASAKLFPGIVGLDIRNRALGSANDLSEVQRERLAVQAEEFFRVQSGDSLEDYLSLIESLGGAMNATRDSDDFKQMQAWWEDQRTRTGIVSWDELGVHVEQTKLEQIPSGPQPPSPPKTLGGVRSVHFSRFHFSRSPDDLAKHGAPIMRITVPTIIKQNDAVMMSVLFVWDETSGNWLPWRQFFEGEPRKGVPRRVF